jgi:hypothetical protein
MDKTIYRQTSGQRLSVDSCRGREKELYRTVSSFQERLSPRRHRGTQRKIVPLRKAE